jgi:DHA1 family bicyclomycin/chloramphenicol resistance-like MFS transporter
MATLPIGSKRWIVALAALTGTTALSIDMSLPAQPTLARIFAVPPETAQLVLSTFLLGFAFAQLVAGPVSDALGRRRVLLAGLALFTLAGAACAVTGSIRALLACRVLQGIGAAAASVVARAMVRDTQPPASAARVLSSMMAVLALAPMIAPMIGGAVLVHLGWRAIFGTLAMCGVLLATMAFGLEETYPPERRTRGTSARELVVGYVRFLRTPGTRAPLLLGCLSFAGQFAYISASPFVLIDGYRVPAGHYAFYFAATALMLMIGSMIGGRMLSSGAPPSRMLVIGSSTLLAGGALAAIGTRIPALGVYGLMIPMLVYFVGIGLGGPSATASTMAPVPELAGTASAAIGFSSMIAGALSGWITTAIGRSDPRILGTAVAVMGACASMLVLVSRATASRPAASEKLHG